MNVALEWARVIATLVSAGCAIFSARLALNALEASGRNRRLEKLEKNYATFVSGPARDALQVFRGSVSEAYNRTKAELESHDSTTVLQATVLLSTKHLVDAFTEAYYTLSDSMFGVQAIDDPVLHGRLRQLMEAMEDAVTIELEKPDRPDVRGTVKKHCAGILKLIMDHDPGVLAPPTTPGH